MNQFKKAIDNNQIKEFFFGIGEFNYYDNEFPQTNFTYSTLKQIRLFFDEYGFDFSMELVLNNLKKFIFENPNPKELLYIAYFLRNITKEKLLLLNQSQIDLIRELLADLVEIHSRFVEMYGQSIKGKETDISYTNYATSSHIEGLLELLKTK